PTLLTPAGYVFAIWGVIYVLLGAFVVYQALPRNHEKPFHDEIGWLFVLSCLFNVLWIFAWQHLYLSLSVLLIVGLLVSLILIYLRLDIGRRKVDRGERVAVHLPFSVYLGWITIATVADISVTLVSLNWDGSGIGLETWAVIVFLLILVIAMLVAFLRRDVAYELVVIWAFVGIAVNQNSNTNIVDLMILGAILVALATVINVLWARWFRDKGFPT
ncbi:MAG TPA: TspO/MBR family protein, partial [Methanomassiliicoccales archaeon]|nr:TspO/MBR family protein [Methanomassiliicoccales archaeon]